MASSLTALQAKADALYKRRKVLQDNIHGKIVLHPVCVRIINTPQFNRLRHIKQLSTCYYVYPTASHNRFEHSIGTYYLAGKLLRSIKDRQPGEVSDVDILCVEIAGLCHELGQGPWSYFFEKHFMPDLKIEFSAKATARKMFEEMLECDEGRLKEDIQQILRECYLKEFDENDFLFIKEMIDDPKDIEAVPWPYEGRPESKSFLYEIIRGASLALESSHAQEVTVRKVKGNRILKIRLHNLESRFAIETRISDALIAANNNIKIGGKKITETIDDMKAYTLLTDDVVQIIMNAEDSDPKQAQISDTDDKSCLSRAHEILLDIMQRRFYKCVSEAKCKDEKIGKMEILDAIQKQLKKEGVEKLPKTFMQVDVVELNYGMKSKNPLENVQFYKKDDLDKSFNIKKDQFLFSLPDTFEERIIRIYCYPKDDSQEELAQKVKMAFEKWCPTKGYDITMGKTCDQTKLNEAYTSSQSEPGQIALNIPNDADQAVNEVSSLECESMEDPTSYDGETIYHRIPEEEQSNK